MRRMMEVKGKERSGVEKVEQAGEERRENQKGRKKGGRKKTLLT